MSKLNLLGVGIDAVTYDVAVDRVIGAAIAGEGMAVSALAVHGVMEAVADPEQRYRINHFDLVCPDGQWVRHGLNWLHKAKLTDRVYGPELTLRVCERAAAGALPVYLYGSTREVLDRLQANLVARFPALRIAGSEASKFRTTTPDEQDEIADRIKRSGARIVLVGLGCPRQEIFAYEYREKVGMPLLAVGAAFDFHAGLLSQAPPWMQRRGLEWLYRLLQEPKRLWRRYLILNPLYLMRVSLQLLRLKRFSTDDVAHPRRVLVG